MEMFVCRDCVSKPEIREELSLFFCGDVTFNQTCPNCGGTNFVVFDGSDGCKGCPYFDNCCTA